MTRALPRTNFHSSKLIRFFADLALVDATQPGNAFAEELALWLDFADAITLRAAHDARTAPPSQAPSGVPGAAGTLVGDAFARVRATLTQSIAKSCAPSPVKTTRGAKASPAAPTEAPMDAASAFAPYRRSYLALQREMDASIRPLRAGVREVLAKASPALAKLAALDGALDAILRERESKLLSIVPWLLEKRFAQLFTPPAHTQAASPTLAPPAQGGVGRFQHELQTVLLAELELRLQPTLGLMEALHHATTQPP